MATFKSFFHVERMAENKMDVPAFLQGEVLAFSKLDGTNSVVWADRGEIHCGSRKREVSVEHDNADFMLFMTTDKSTQKLRDFLLENENLIVYGEWLSGWRGRKQTGTIKQYVDPGFWIIAVFDIDADNYLYYDTYAEMLNGIYDKIDRPIARLTNPKYEDCAALLNDNHFNLPDDVKGEGVVFYNYDYRDRFGHPMIAKIVAEEYYAGKGNSPKKRAAIMREGLEQDIVEAFVTDADCAKCQQKVMVMFNMDEWVVNGKVIGAYLNLLFHDLVEEEMWAIIKSFRNPIIDFGVLKNNVMIKGRQYLGLI